MAQKFNKLAKILRSAGVEIAYQFGSSVSGSMRKDSDVDIAVLLPSKLSTEKMFSTRLLLIEQLTKLYKKQIDLVVLNQASSILLKFNIIKSGRVIYIMSAVARMLFELKVMNEYFDFQPFLSMLKKRYVR